MQLYASRKFQYEPWRDWDWERTDCSLLTLERHYAAAIIMVGHRDMMAGSVIAHSA